MDFKGGGGRGIRAHTRMWVGRAGVTSATLRARVLLVAGAGRFLSSCEGWFVWRKRRTVPQKHANFGKVRGGTYGEHAKRRLYSHTLPTYIRSYE